MTAQLISAIRLQLRPLRQSGDSELLDRFVRQRDERAFEEILHRHGPMVRAVCRRMLGPTPDADDAFQATFLVLVRKARLIRRRELLANWLCAVAYRAAHTLRRSRSRQRQHECTAGSIPERAIPAGEPRDWLPLFDAALQRLPERYRSAVVLCELQGKSRLEAAELLGLNEGTLSSRLARARLMMRRELGRHGFPLAVGAALCPAAVPEALAAATCRHASALAAMPAGVIQIMEGVLSEMAQNKLRLGTILIATVLASAGLTLAGGKKQTPIPPASGKTAGLQERERVPPPVQLKQPVAIINGNVPISREEYGEYLIRQFGAEKLEAFVNRRIIERACESRNITVTDLEIEEVLQQDLKQLNIDQDRFANTFLKQYGKTLASWKDDTIRCKLLLKKLVGATIRVSESELRQEFENRFGKRVKCEILSWPKSEAREAEVASRKIRSGILDFAQKQFSPPATYHPGFAIGKQANSPENQKIVDAAFALKPGEISALITRSEDLVLLKCLETIPAANDIKFNEEKPALLKIVTDKKIAAEVAQQFKDLKEAAKPQLLLK